MSQMLDPQRTVQEPTNTIPDQAPTSITTDQESARIDREQRHEAGGYYKRPTTIVRGAGALVWDDAGREYIDGVGGIGVASVGHANPRLAAAIAAQAHVLITCPELFHNDIRARYLERLAAVLPAGMDRIFLANSGTEVVEAAIKTARSATGRSGIVATMRGFHGRTLGALSATWDPQYRLPYAPLVPDFHHIRFDDREALDSAITDATAAIIIEPVQGEGGIHPASAAFLQTAARLCQERGALLIFDEIQCGFGRTGRMWAHEHVGVVPDLLCMAKGIAGGFPLGALGFGPRAPSFPPGLHGSTFGGNPLACAAGLAVLDEFVARDLIANAALQGERLRAGLAALMPTTPAIRAVRGLGLMVGVELRMKVQPVLERLTERGVLALTAGNLVIRLLPPLVITADQVDQIIATFAEVLR